MTKVDTTILSWDELTRSFRPKKYLNTIQIKYFNCFSLKITMTLRYFCCCFSSRPLEHESVLQPLQCRLRYTPIPSIMTRVHIHRARLYAANSLARGTMRLA